MYLTFDVNISKKNHVFLRIVIETGFNADKSKKLKWKSRSILLAFKINSLILSGIDYVIVDGHNPEENTPNCNFKLLRGIKDYRTNTGELIESQPLFDKSLVRAVVDETTIDDIWYLINGECQPE